MVFHQYISILSESVTFPPGNGSADRIQSNVRNLTVRGKMQHRRSFNKKGCSTEQWRWIFLTAIMLIRSLRGAIGLAQGGLDAAASTQGQFGSST
jgi:hypothetical protein